MARLVQSGGLAHKIGMNGGRVFGTMMLVAATGALGLAVGWMLKERSIIRSEPKAMEERVTAKNFIPPADPLPAETGLASDLNRWLALPDLEAALIGFCVLDEHGEVVFSSPLAKTALCPASALKTVTTGAAMGLLGPEFCFETQLISNGDLVLKGSGDPTLEAEDLDALAAEAVNNGLKRVDGVLRIDASIFPDQPVNDHWNWGDIGNAYGTGAYGINLGHNVLNLKFTPGEKEGDVAKLVGTDPRMDAGRWDVKVATGPAGSGDRVMIYSAPYSDKIRMSGTVPMGEISFSVRGAIPDPPALAAAVLRAALEKRGVIFSGKKVAEKPAAVVARHRSKPLPEIIDHLHAVSDNLEAQCLFLAMGNLERAEPAEVVARYWERAGISFAGLRLIDGSGLARATMIRPLDLAKVNYAARHAATGDRFFQSMPRGQNEMIRSKRGAMSGVKTEVGFIDRNGREFTFALMANGLKADVDFWRLRIPLLDAVGR